MFAFAEVGFEGSGGGELLGEGGYGGAVEEDGKAGGFRVENCMVAVVLVGFEGDENEVGLVRLLGARSLADDAFWR